VLRRGHQETTEVPRRNTDRTKRKLKIRRTGGKAMETSMTGWVSA
jgi:hypothetical protein